MLNWFAQFSIFFLNTILFSIWKYRVDLIKLNFNNRHQSFHLDRRSYQSLLPDLNQDHLHLLP